MLEGLTGGLQKRASIIAEGRWDVRRETIIFEERYSFDDGHVDTLRWLIARVGKGSYKGQRTNA